MSGPLEAERVRAMLDARRRPARHRLRYRNIESNHRADRELRALRRIRDLTHGAVRAFDAAQKLGTWAATRLLDPAGRANINDYPEAQLIACAPALADAWLTIRDELAQTLETLAPWERAKVPYVGPIADALREILPGGRDE